MPWSWTQTLPRPARAGEGEWCMGRFRRKTAAGDRADRREERRARREQELRAIRGCREPEGGLGPRERPSSPARHRATAPLPARGSKIPIRCIRPTRCGVPGSKPSNKRRNARAAETSGPPLSRSPRPGRVSRGISGGTCARCGLCHHLSAASRRRVLAGLLDFRQQVMGAIPQGPLWMKVGSAVAVFDGTLKGNDIDGIDADFIDGDFIDFLAASTYSCAS